MDLVAPEPHFNLYNRIWPIHTLGRDLPPAKFVKDGSLGCDVTNSMVSRGVIVSGGTVNDSVLSPGVRVAAGAVVENSIIMDDTFIGPGAVVKGAIVDKHVEIKAGARLGEDPAGDAERATVSERGVVAVAKGSVVE